MGESLTKPDLNKYYDTFEEFITYINDIHKQPIVNKTLEGYLVNYNDYIELKELVYKYYKEKQQKLKFGNNMYDDHETRWINEIKSKKLKTESLEDVIKQISNEKKFIIINNDTYEIICKKPESQKENHKIYYILEDKDHLIISLSKEKSIRFKNNDNIIEKSEADNNTKSSNSINEWQKYEKNWEKIYRDTKNYFINENDISEQLKTGQNKMIQGFLVDKEWIDKWKKYSYYERIKENIYLKNINNEIEIKKFIINEMKNSYLNYDDIKAGIENFILKNENQINKI